MTTLWWSTANICWRSMAQDPPDLRNHTRAIKQANVCLGSFFFAIYHSGNLSSCFMLRGYWILGLELEKWRCYTPILLETRHKAFLHHDHINSFDSRAVRFRCLTFWCKEFCDCKMHVSHFSGAENIEERYLSWKQYDPEGFQWEKEPSYQRGFRMLLSRSLILPPSSIASKVYTIYRLQHSRQSLERAISVINKINI